MKRIITALFCACIAFAGKAQNLIAEGTAPNLYISHTVAPKENFYSIGRLYNQTPKQIASFNNLVMEKGLKIGQHIKIPLNANNFDASGKTEAGETLMPLTHVVVKSETLYKIGTDFKVPAQSLKQWNNLSSDNVTVGAPLIIGHLKVKGDQAAVASVKANASSGAPVVATKPQEQKPTPVVVKEQPIVVAPPAVKEEKKDDKTFSSIEVNKPGPTAAIPHAESKEEPGKETAVKTAPVKEPMKEAVKEPVKEQPHAQTSTPPAQGQAKIEKKGIDLSSSAEGAFSSVFSGELSKKSLNSKAGEAATFKSTSGWQDKKYYVLMNDAPPNTIVKIQGGPEQKVVYAKVLGSMPEMKENNGLLLRVSNAAAAYLGIVDPKFNVEVSYYQ